MAFKLFDNIAPRRTKGNWFGLPEFGITEAFGGKRGSLQQGDDYLYGAVPAAELETNYSTPEDLGMTYEEMWGTPEESGGDVLGTAGGNTGTPTMTGSDGGTGVGTGTPTDQGSIQKELAETTEGGINQEYAATLDYLSGLESNLPEQEQRREDFIKSSYSTQQDTMGTNRDVALQNLTGAEKRVRGEQKKSIRQLEEDARNLLQAASRQFGAIGAGWSSAAQRLPNAVYKTISRNRSNIKNEANRMLNDIAGKKANVQATYDTQLNKLKQWRDENLYNIGNWVDQMQNQIAEAEATADKGRIQQLTAAKQNQLQDALNVLRQIDQAAVNYASQLSSWKAERTGKLDTIGEALKNAGVYEVGGIPIGQLPQFQGFQGNQRAAYYGGTSDEEEYPTSLSDLVA